MTKPPPQIPQGNESVWRGINENFTFHASPESFIVSRILAFHRDNPNAIKTRVPVRAKILNRNVAVISSYNHVKQVLENRSGEEDDSPPYVASAAYSELMNSFFPPPNLLLSDGKQHRHARCVWDARMEALSDSLVSSSRTAARRHFGRIATETEFDLYGSMKTLAWELLFGAFLDLHPGDKEFDIYQRLHEDLLRGQFSLLPVSLNFGFWHSPRKIGVDARKRLQDLIAEKLKTSHKCCPFDMPDEKARKEVADHTLLFTSSLAAKGLASLMTAFLLNLFLYRDSENLSSAERLLRLEDVAARKEYLERILTETERLSPPIVGVMRRCARETTLSNADDQPDVILPAGWDVWMYFTGAGRDPEKFGERHDVYDPKRAPEGQLGSSLAFGAGPKTCLGQVVSRRFVLAVAEACLEMKLKFLAGELPRGVRGWLGWESGVHSNDWATDMKQLPTQRPARPIKVTVSKY